MRTGCPLCKLEEWLPVIFFAVAAIGMGHAGAILAGYRKRHDGFPFFEPIFSSQKQLTIRFLFKVTLIVAVLAAVFKATGPIAQNVALTWMAYLLFQTLLLVCDHWITRWLASEEVLHGS